MSFNVLSESDKKKKLSLNESPASNLEIKRLAKLLFTKFKKSGARVKLGTDVGTIDQKGKVDGWDDISQALGDNDAIINYGIGNGKEGIHLSLVGDKANSLQGEIEDFVNQGDVKLLKYPGNMPFKDSKGKMRKAQAYFIEPGKSMSENLDESATQYAAIIRDLYPGKSWEELTSSEQFEVRSTYEDFN